MTQQLPRRPRPRALIALGWLLIGQAALALATLGGVVAALLAARSGLPGFAPDEIRGTALLTNSAGVGGIVSLVSGIGLLRRQGWAWLLALITQGLVLVVALADYWLGDPDYLSLALGVALVYLLNRADVQQAIRPAGPNAAEALPTQTAAALEPTDVP